MRRSGLLENKHDEGNAPAVRIAETVEEYRQAFSLVQAEYHKVGYISPHPSNMYYNIWSLLPTTNIMIAKANSAIISTVAMIADTEEFSLPMDGEYKKEVDVVRNKGRRTIVEVGANVTTSSQRWYNAPILMFRGIYHYCKIAGVTDLVIVINPKHVRFFSEIMMFEIIGEERTYRRMNLPGVAMHRDMTTYDDLLRQGYAGTGPSSNLYTFYWDFDAASLAYMSRVLNNTNTGRAPHLDSVDIFVENRPEILDEFSEKQVALFESLYHSEEKAVA